MINWQNQHNSEFQVDVLIDNYESVDEFVTCLLYTSDAADE